MADINTDLSRIESDETKLSGVISAVGTHLADVVKSNADLTAQIAALKASGVDTARVEAIAANIETSISAAQGLLPAAPPVASVNPTT